MITKLSHQVITRRSGACDPILHPGTPSGTSSPRCCPPARSTTRSAATASASPTASSSDKLIQILGLDRRDRRIADHSCSATTLRRRRDEWIALGVADPVPPPDIGRLTIACTAWTWSAWRWTAASPRPCGGRVAGRQTVTLRRGPDRGGLVLLALFSGRHAPRACGEGGWPSRDARLGRRPPSHTGGPDGRSRPGRLDTYSNSRPDRTRADTLADGHRRSRPYGGLSRSSFRTPRPTRTDGRLQTTRGTRPAMRSAAVAVRLGVRSRRPAGQARCPSWTAVRAGVRVGVRPSVWECPSDRLSCLEGAGEQDERALAIGEAAPGPRPLGRGRLSAATSRSCSRPSRTPLQRVHHGV